SNSDSEPWIHSIFLEAANWTPKAARLAGKRYHISKKNWERQGSPYAWRRVISETGTVRPVYQGAFILVRFFVSIASLYHELENLMAGTDCLRRLNVGCGRDIKPGWINLDLAALPGVDVVADLEKCATDPLPLKPDSIDEFLLSHLIEHIANALPLMQELHR